VSRPVVVVTRRLPAAVEEAVAKEFDARLNREDRPLSAAELQEALRTADALLPTVTDKITAEVLSVEPLRAKIIANFGVGFNNIDVAAAKARGLAVSNTPDVLTDATADLAMTLSWRRGGPARGSGSSAPATGPAGGRRSCSAGWCRARRSA
jgi:lactate dehydrogenase-like 2-hydroxyacid dehydrogenase